MISQGLGRNIKSLLWICAPNVVGTRLKEVCVLAVMLLLQEHYCLALGVTGMDCSWLAAGLQLEQLRALNS
jgi:hypothetical protein